MRLSKTMIEALQLAALQDGVAALGWAQTRNIGRVREATLCALHDRLLVERVEGRPWTYRASPTGLAFLDGYRQGVAVLEAAATDARDALVEIADGAEEEDDLQAAHYARHRIDALNLALARVGGGR